MCLPWAPRGARAEVSWAHSQPGSPAVGCSTPRSCAKHQFCLCMSPVQLICLHSPGWCSHVSCGEGTGTMCRRDVYPVHCVQESCVQRGRARCTHDRHPVHMGHKPCTVGTCTLCRGDMHRVQRVNTPCAEGKCTVCQRDKHPVHRGIILCPRETCTLCRGDGHLEQRGNAPSADQTCTQCRADRHPVQRGHIPCVERTVTQMQRGNVTCAEGAGTPCRGDGFPSRRSGSPGLGAAERYRRDLLPPACGGLSAARSTGTRLARLSLRVPGSPRVTCPAGRQPLPARPGGHQDLYPGCSALPPAGELPREPGQAKGDSWGDMATLSGHPSHQDTHPTKTPIPPGYPSRQGTHLTSTPIPLCYPSHQDTHPARASCQEPTHPSMQLAQAPQ